MLKTSRLILVSGVLLTLVACGKTTSTTPVATTHPQFGREIWLASASMLPKEEKNPVNGVVIAHEFSSGDAVLDAKVNVALPKAGMEYILRLEGENVEPFFMGEFLSPMQDVRHSLHYTGKTTLGNYTVARMYRVVKGQKTGGNLVAEGTLQVRKNEK
jgi:hypothetical protein